MSDEFETDTMWECDWTQKETFKQNVLALKQKYTFISLKEAYNHISCDKLRWANYAVLTSDDGWASSKDILPWLVEVEIPVTLFLNPMYFDGIHKQSRETEKLLTMVEVEDLVRSCSPYVTIASHGWSHKDCLKMTDAEFAADVDRAEQSLSNIDGKIPFYAFTFGRHRKNQLAVLHEKHLIPVLMDGNKNYSYARCIHRELLDGKLCCDII